MYPSGAGAAPPDAVLFAGRPDHREQAAVRRRIRELRMALSHRIAVLDDDPTGSQSVHGVVVVTVRESGQFWQALRPELATCFVLTNTRSLAEASAVDLTRATAATLLELAGRLGGSFDMVSRSDSTLRGHLIAETRTLAEAKRAATGHGYDAVLLAPAYFEAGRVTVDDVQWARVSGRLVPVGETEFARDSTFGFTSSNLRELIVERTGGAVRTERVRSISLDDIRIGGPGRVAETLHGVRDGGFVVVNGTRYDDYETVAAGALEARAGGQSLLYRTGPSFVRALAGIEPQEPLTTRQIWPGGHPGGHGLVVVGSHVGLTSRQLAVALSRTGLTEVGLDVPTLLDPVRGKGHIVRVGTRVAEVLAESDVLLSTSRAVERGRDPDDSLAISRRVSSAVVEVTRHALAAKPTWVVSKGGITSHDIATGALGFRRARVMGQLLPGMVSVFEGVEMSPAADGVRLVVFAGNVGDENTLADVIERLRDHR